ncbi:MAG: hypothetical protein PSN37_03360 [Alphaproteobacteria bacterium]|nr:hypothetical protein [Alphaproteobacteria bacterium]
MRLLSVAQGWGSYAGSGIQSGKEEYFLICILQKGTPIKLHETFSDIILLQLIKFSAIGNVPDLEPRSFVWR